MKSLISLLVLFTLFLSGCGTMVKPISKGSIENKTFVLVPTGQTKYEVSTNKGGAVFGILGALIEVALTQSSSDATKVKLRDAVPPEFLLQTAVGQIETDLKKYGNYKLKVYKNHTLKNAFYDDWSKNTKREDLKNIPEIDGDIIVEVGVTNISLVKSLGGTDALLWTSLRFINRNTGEMHGQVFDFVSSSTAGVNVDLNEDANSFQTDARDIYTKLVKASVNNALVKIFEVSPSEAAIKSPQISPTNLSQSSESNPIQASIPALPKTSDTSKTGSLGTVSDQSLSAKKLYELKMLLDKGLISQKDYDVKKSEILKTM
jgi:hypothetical protein